MAEQAGSLINTLLAQVRDPGGLGTTRDQVRLLISHAQRLVNAAVDLVISNATLNTSAYQQVYPITANLPLAIRVTGVQVSGGQDLTREEDFSLYDRKWFRRTGSRFESWGTVGRDLLILHPALTAASSVTVFYVALTTALAQDNTPTDMPDFMLPAVLDLAEFMLIAKVRQFDSVRDVLRSLATRLHDQRIADMLEDVVLQAPATP